MSEYVRKLQSDYFPLIAILLYVSLALVKMRNYLTEGRFWAEEGVHFYTNISQSDAFHGLLYNFHGHLELVANTIVLISTFFDIKYAPLITTYLSLLIQTLPILILSYYRKDLNLTNLQLLAFIVIACGIPQSAEVWTNSINLYFHLSLLVAIIATLDIKSGFQKHLLRVLLLISGLSGIPTNFLTPVFFLRAIQTGERERWLQFGILAFTSLLQISLLIHNNFHVGDDRSFTFSPLTYWLIIIAQCFISPLFGSGIGDQLSNILRESYSFHPGNWIFVVICSTPLLMLASWALRNRKEPAFYLFLSATLLLLLSIFSAAGNKVSFISVASGGRYFYAPSLILILCLLLYLKRINIAAYALLAGILITSVHDIPSYSGGPSWRTSLDKAISHHKDQVAIWPNGWFMHLPK